MWSRRRPTVNNEPRYIVNGDVALIEVANEDEHAVWRVPASALEWALSLFPITLRRLPDLESPEAYEIRKLKRRAKSLPSQFNVFAQEIEFLEEAEARAYPPVPRYRLVKYQDGEEIPVHRLFVNAGPADEVEAVNNNYLDFTTTKITITMSLLPAPKAKGNPDLVWSEEKVIQNLRIVNNAKAQEDFENAVKQYRYDPSGNILTKWTVTPSDLGARTGVEGGKIEDCGDHKPLTDRERVNAGLAEFHPKEIEFNPEDEVKRLRAAWKVPQGSKARGLRWG
jgi:hypothetical protein